MKCIHRENNRGKVDMGWTKTAHSFSFGEYFNPQMMGFGKLRVINDDIIPGGQGIGMHPHSNMEIITIPISGSIQHKDSMGNETIIHTGEVQAMSAGTGILHSEMNHSQEKPVELFQIWIETKTKNIQPRYNQKSFKDYNLNEIQLLVSPENNSEVVHIHQDAFISRVRLINNSEIEYKKHNNDNGIYFFLIDGEAKIEGEKLHYRDAIGITETDNIKLKSINNTTDILIFEVPMGE